MREAPFWLRMMSGIASGVSRRRIDDQPQHIPGAPTPALMPQQCRLTVVLSPRLASIYRPAIGKFAMIAQMNESQ